MGLQAPPFFLPFERKKMIRKIFLGIIILFVSSAIIGFIYFKDAFKAPSNLCSIEGNSTELNIAWASNGRSDRSGMLVPVHIADISDTLWMQLDLGAVYSVLYNTTLTS